MISGKPEVHVTAVIAAYNEEKTIAKVLESVKACPYIKQIIVVDDGSTDQTSDLARKYATTLIRHKKNQGKSEAIIDALQEVKNEIVFLCDADLVGLTPEICTKIIEPVAKRKADMSVGMRNYGIFNYPALFLPSISGERVMRLKTARESIKSKYFRNWGMELVLDYYCKTHRLKTVQKPYLYNHTHLVKKRGLIAGLVAAANQAIILINVFLAIKIKGWH